MNQAPEKNDLTDVAGEAGAVWWGEHSMAIGQRGRFRVGPLTVWARRSPFEWCVSHQREEDRYAESVSIECPLDPSDEDSEDYHPPEEAESVRLMADEPGERLHVRPVLADRPVVTRPDGTCRVLPGTTVTLYVSSPLWFRLETLVDREALLETAIVRPTDTWFGPSTRHGELCYAIRTPAALEPDELPVLPSRAVTRVRVVNRGGDDLELVRVALPAPNLGLFLDRDQPELGLFTSAVTVERSGDEMADVSIDRRPPPELRSPERVAEPRSPHSRNFLARAMSSILS